VASLQLVPGLVTGVGSLPHTDPRAAAAFALASTPGLPAMPGGGDMIEHAVAGGLADSERAFLEAYPDGPVKAQLVGPVTLAVALGDDERALELVRRNARVLAEQLEGRPVLCVLDEPLLGGFHPLHASGLLLQSLPEVETFAVTGVHCCGPADWGAIVGAGPRVLSLPVELAGSLSWRAMRRHLHGGGWIAWGAVPTDRSVSADEVDDLWRALDTQLGLDARLAAHSIVTPACGLANHTNEQAETVFALARELGRRVAAK
jgi:hypothetical protein